MKIVLKSDGTVIATHDDTQDITLDLYPQASHVITNYPSIIQDELDGDGNVVRQYVDAEYIVDSSPVEFTIPSAIIRPSQPEYVADVHSLVTEGQTIGTVTVAPIEEGALVKVSMLKQAYDSLSEERKTQIATLASLYAQ